MLGTLKQKVADADLMQLGRRREWRAFRDGVESARSHLDELIESGEPVEVVFEALEKKVPYLHRLKDKYMDRPGLITSIRGTSQKVSSEDLATAGQIASLYMGVYNYAQSLGYDIGTLEKLRLQ
ncbi:MAG TPA: hypothetical protein VJB90_00605 [Candidatus Nanoarchaeia archaeon]|nr:hypothetical protein [Candidatus Nanoarchaeia archaeon]